MKERMRKLSLPLAVAAALVMIAGTWAGALAAGDQAAIGQKLVGPLSTRAPIPTFVGGMSSADTVSRPLTMDASGNLKTWQMNRASDDNTIVNVLGGVTICDSLYVATGFADVTQFKDMQIHVSWSDSSGTQAEVDSLLFEIIPVGKRSLTVDGFDYVINLGGLATVVATGVSVSDTVLSGWTIGSGRNPTMTQASLAPQSNIFIPNHYVYRIGNNRPTAGQVSKDKFLYSVSFPFATKNGASINEHYVGFLVRPLSRSVTTATCLKSLTIDIVGKGN